MKTIRINFLAVIGIMVAMGTVAFTAPTKNLNEDALHWFIKDQDTEVYEYSEEGLTVDCPEDGLELCAKGFEIMPTVTVTDNLSSDAERYIEAD